MHLENCLLQIESLTNFPNNLQSSFGFLSLVFFSIGTWIGREIGVRRGEGGLDLGLVVALDGISLPAPSLSIAVSSANALVALFG